MSKGNGEKREPGAHDELLYAVEAAAMLLALQQHRGKGALIPRMRQAAHAVRALEAYLARRTDDELGDAFLFEALTCLDIKAARPDDWPSLEALKAAKHLLERRRKKPL